MSDMQPGEGPSGLRMLPPEKCECCVTCRLQTSIKTFATSAIARSNNDGWTTTPSEIWQSSRKQSTVCVHWVTQQFSNELWNVHIDTLYDVPRTNNMGKWVNYRFLQLTGHPKPMTQALFRNGPLEDFLPWCRSLDFSRYNYVTRDPIDKTVITTQCYVVY